ncbi:MAG TPA: MFS transporter [Candidatus Limnocylindrales bacterium]|nr:MFS transporter [Candidatus Limnocylindrales bacterium]
MALSPAARARLVYVTFYGAVGTMSPYLVLFYKGIGLDLAAIGLVVGFGSVVALLAGPGWGFVSDRLRGSPVVVVAAATSAIVGVLTMYQARDLSGVLGCSILLSAGFAGLTPILDARALEISGPERSGYGPLRAWGSISYIALSFGTGAAIDAWGLGAAFAIGTAMLALTAVIGATLVGRVASSPARSAAGPSIPATAPPRSPEPAVRAGRRIGTLSALRLVWLGPLGLFIGGAWLTFMGLAGVMAFYSLRYAELAAPASVIGLSSAIGAAVEVPIMLTFPRLAARLGAERLVVAGAAIFTIRAFVAATTADPIILVLLAGIGGAGYACFIIGGVTYVSRQAQPGLAATAQGLFSGLANGLGQVVAGYGGGLIAGAVGITGLFGASGVLGLGAAGVVALAVRRRARPLPALGYSTAPDA